MMTLQPYSDTGGAPWGVFTGGPYTSNIPGANPNPTGSNLVPSNTSSPSTPLNAPIGGGLVDGPLVPGTGNINTGPAGTFNPTFMSGLNPSTGTGIPAVGSTDYTNLTKQLDGIFGSGMGSVLLGYLSGGGGFNPQVAQALQNANIPQEQRALANIRESFGAQGLGGGSNEALAMGDYESAFNLGQEGILANLYQGGANNIRDMLSGVLNTAFLDKSNKMSTLDYINSLLPILGAFGLTGSGGSLSSLIQKGGSGLIGLLGKLFGIGGGSNPDMGNPNTNPTLSLPLPGTGNDVGGLTPPFDPTSGIPGVSPTPIDITGVTDTGGGGGTGDINGWWNDPSSWGGF